MISYGIIKEVKGNNYYNVKIKNLFYNNIVSLSNKVYNKNDIVYLLYVDSVYLIIGNIKEDKIL